MMSSESLHGADLESLTASARQLSEHVRRYKSAKSDLRSVEIRVASNDKGPDSKTTESDSPGALNIFVTFEADTQAHAEAHAQEMIDANPPGSTSCTSSGPTSVTCQYEE